MKRTPIGVAVAAALSLYGLTALAGDSGTAAPQRQSSAATHQGFNSSPCRAARSASFERVELSAFDVWHGAWTTPAGNREALVFGASPQAVAPVSVGPEQTAAAQHSGPSLREQRQRFFALGLAVLLNLNQNR